jgi:phage virion morphogenesis protein
MTGVALHIDLSGIERLQQKLDKLGRFSRRELLDVVGATVESQTRRRITDEKSSPQGEAWSKWSDRYARRRHGGHSLLQGQGDLLDSIGYAVGADEVEIGSNLIYAATHQFGDADRNIPERAYLGLSTDNEADLAADIEEWFRRILS